jgi:hypothetical protein
VPDIFEEEKAPPPLGARYFWGREFVLHSIRAVERDTAPVSIFKYMQ